MPIVNLAQDQVLAILKTLPQLYRVSIIYSSSVELSSMPFYHLPSRRDPDIALLPHHT